MPICKGDHEVYVEVPMIDTYCDNLCKENWVPPECTPVRHCICASGYGREYYPDGPCIAGFKCLSEETDLL